MSARLATATAVALNLLHRHGPRADLAFGYHDLFVY